MAYVPCFVSAGLINWWETEGISDLKIYGTSLALALIVRTVAVEPRFIPSLSMYPTFEIGDQLAVDKLSVRFARPYQRKDVVVFHPPPKFSEFSNRGSDEVSAAVERSGVFSAMMATPMVDINSRYNVFVAHQQMERHRLRSPLSIHCELSKGTSQHYAVSRVMLKPSLITSNGSRMGDVRDVLSWM